MVPSNLSETIHELLNQLRRGAEDVLGADLVGVYVRGSLATGDFEPERSDVDLLVVTGTPVDEAQFRRLQALHHRIAKSDNPYGDRLEVAYIDRSNLRVFQPGKHHPTIGQGEILTWQEHGANWLLERWTLREHGLTLTGPDPKRLIDPVSAREIKRAVADRMADWSDWAQDEEDPDWHLPLNHKAYAIETMCRALYTASLGTIPNKTEAVDWALARLPEHWQNLVHRSRGWRTSDRVEPAFNPQVQSFILWAAGRVQELVEADRTASTEGE